MSIGTLYTIPSQARGKTIRAAAAQGDLVLDVPSSYVHFVDNKKPEFLAKFPHGKIPALETKNGFLLFESAAIASYVASLAPNAGLLGTTPEEQALVNQWAHFAETEIDNFSSLIFQLLKGSLSPYNKPLHNAFAERQLRSLNTVEQHLSTRTFLVKERITLADISMASSLARAVTITVDAPLRAKLPNTMRFLETVVNQPKMKAVYGDIEYVEKALQYVPPAKEKKEPAKEKKEPAAPKEKAKPKPKVVEDDDDDDEPLVPEEPKAKNPLDSLPKSTFNLEDWKRAYSNKETRGAGGSLEWFYENFDKEGFSIWRVDFKYNDELTQTFMSANQIGGFFNRLEGSRKYLFGSMGVLGKTNDSIISGAFILRGREVVPVVEVAPDYESYEFKRLNIENGEDKAFFEAALAWDLEIEGKKWVDGKNFK